MERERGAVAKRARYVAEMAQLLAERAGSYESACEETGSSFAYAGYEVRQAESKSNVERMIVQLRLELLELGRMI